MGRINAIAAVLSCVLMVSATAAFASGPLPPRRLRVEYMDSPLGVDLDYAPRLSWALAHTVRGQAQTAYQIEVDQVSPTPGLFWDSGIVHSNVSQNVHLGTTTTSSGTTTTPAGPTKELPADATFSWKVRYWDTSSTASNWSAPAVFSTGLRGDWGQADWIAASATSMVGGQLRTEFPNAKKPISQAYAYIIGLGYYKLDVNGERASKHELGSFTTYEKRVYYDTWDVTRTLNDNAAETHAVGVHLGQGWFSQSSVHVGAPRLLFTLKIHYADGSSDEVVSKAAGSSSSSSSSSWTVNPGPVTDVDIYKGESYDARLETPGWTAPGFAASSSSWTPALASAPPTPNTTLSSHAVLPPIRIGETYAPCNVYQSAPGVYVFDFCQNMAGFVTMRLPSGLGCNTGHTISMQHAEAVHGPPPAGIFHHYGNTAENNSYVCRGDGAAADYTPLFTYAGFRYVALHNYPGVPDFKTLTAHFLHTDYEMTGSISFSDPMLDAVQHITRTAAMSNFQSIPTDCPQRERRGWLGDAQLSAETNMHNFDMGAPYTSFVQQIDDALSPEGATPDCVPYYGHGKSPSDPAWGAAFTLIADWVGTYYHDNQIFASHYDGIRAHMEELIATAAKGNMDGLLTYGGWGDWCPPQGCHACWSKDSGELSQNSVVVSSFYYITELRILARYAGILGKSDDAKRYATLATQAAAAFQRHFYDSTAKTFVENNRTCGEYLSPQTLISLAAQLDLIPSADYDAVIDNLVADVAAHGWHLNVGIVGVKYLLPALSAGGRGDVALMIAQARTPPSYIYMVEQGATTLWETWTGSRYSPVASWNHIMFGSNSDWYYKYLAGLNQASGSRGWQQLELRPQVWNARRGVSICANLSSTEASIVTPRGEARTAWACAASGACGLAAEKDTLKLDCPGSTITAIEFASFGTPEGTCAGGAFTKGSCDFNGTVSKVAAACVGKSSCSIPATTGYFGNDPCFDTKKSLAVSATCAKVSGPIFTYDVSVPVGTTAKVALPKFGAKQVLVTEGDNKAAVWDNGQYMPGVAGVSGGAEVNNIIELKIGSGTFSFTVAGK